MSLAGILFGAVLLGSLSDYFGRKRMFIAEMIMFCAFLAQLILCNDFLSLSICLFGLGLALGCDYPTAHMIISENIPSIGDRSDRCIMASRAISILDFGFLCSSPRATAFLHNWANPGS